MFSFGIIMTSELFYVNFLFGCFLIMLMIGTLPNEV